MENNISFQNQLEKSSNLNQQQQIAVETTEGPLLILAGAGTGKTKVLTTRIAHIINSGKASPLEILSVTFTNKAAMEMKNRIKSIIGDIANNIWIGTFHSIASKIIRRHPEIVGLTSDFTIIDDDDQNRLIKQILSDLNIDIKQFPAKNYLNKISRLKDKMISANNIADTEIDYNLPEFTTIYKNYQSRLKSMNSVDFGDLLLYNIEIFHQAPEVLTYYQNKFRYILVDEYQDTNAVQYKWLLKISEIHKNICCVGDDDQSIYSWRGADIANILRFEDDFNNAKIIFLEQNYRSTSRILKVADSVISNNKKRHQKTLWTELGVGEKVNLHSFSDDRFEASKIASYIRNFIFEKKYNFSQIAILVRAGYQTRRFEEAFIQGTLPYRIVGGLKFYERLEIKDSIAYLRIAFNTNDDLAFNRIINVPKRGVGESTIANLYEEAKNQGISLFKAVKNSNNLRGKAKDSLKKLVENIENWQNLSNQLKLTDLAEIILRDSGYLAMWRVENSPEAKARIENIEEFINSLSEFNNISEFLEHITLVENQQEGVNNQAISIMTIHGAKGLEFDLVFVPGLEEGIFPSARAIDEQNNPQREGLEEERRLMYVAITRAKKQLFLSFSQNRFLFGEVQNTTPSRFLKELPESEINFYQSNSNIESFQTFRNHGEGNEKHNHQQQRTKYHYLATNNNNQYQKNQNTENKITENNDYNSQNGNDAFYLKQKVVHSKFGSGFITSIDNNRLTINFKDCGVKTVIKDFIKPF